MEVPKIFESEYRFCLILWEHEPVNSTKLVALCKEQLGWSKATTYTVTRRLAERGVLKNENATVVSAFLQKDEIRGKFEQFKAQYKQDLTKTTFSAKELKEKADSFKAERKMFGQMIGRKNRGRDER